MGVSSLPPRRTNAVRVHRRDPSVGPGGRAVRSALAPDQLHVRPDSATPVDRRRLHAVVRRLARRCFGTRTPASSQADPDAHLPRTCRPCMTERCCARTAAPRRSPGRPERPIAREVDPREETRLDGQCPCLGAREGRRTRRRQGARVCRWSLIRERPAPRRRGLCRSG
jgi:hypothetical protein